MNLREEDSPSDASTCHLRSLVPPTLEELNELIPAYEFLEFVDHGGMGMVYKARQKCLNRIVAIKTLPPANHNRRSFAERFKREAEALAQLTHPHIVAVHDFGETRTGILYFVMEFVKGSNLRRLLKDRGLSTRQMLTIITQVCSALQYAHDHGIIHRDIKPGNILMDEYGNAKVADFGLAKVLGLPQVGDGLTAPLESLGTPDYVAPEVLKGDAEVDHRADIFSLGVMLYEMSTGMLPKGAWEQPSRCGADSRLDEVVSRALQIDPGSRYQQVNDFTQELQEMLRHSEQPTTDRLLTRPKATGPLTATSMDCRRDRSNAILAPPAASPSARWIPLLLALLCLVIAGIAVWESPTVRGWVGIGERSERKITDALPPQVAHPKTEEEMKRDQLALAQWVFNRGGSINVVTPSQKEDHLGDEDSIRFYVNLPKGEFTILRVSFGDDESITDKDLAELLPLIAKAQSVSNLSLRGTQITALGLANLPLLKNTLTCLNIRNTSAFSAQSLPMIVACDRLKKLFVTVPPATSVSDNELVKKLKSLLTECEVF